MGFLFDLVEEIDDDRDPVPIGQAFRNAVVEIGEFWLATWGDKSFRDPVLLRLAYKDYLLTDHWQLTRDRARLRVGGMCQRCETTKQRLDVHHLSYLRLGREAESDLIVLCRECHAAEHGVTP